jgi:antitoxin component HigA of HigAB toxin-antitoxin module
MGLLDIVSFFIRDYEERNIEIPKSEPHAALRFFMDQHGLRQADLAEIFGAPPEGKRTVARMRYSSSSGSRGRPGEQGQPFLRGAISA